MRSATRDPFKQRAGEPLSAPTETFVRRAAGTPPVTHALDNDQQFVGDALAPQTQQALRNQIVDGVPGGLRWPFTMRRHCVIAAAA